MASINHDQQVTLALIANGDGIIVNPQWSQDNPTVLDLLPDGETCIARAKGIGGISVVTVDAENSNGQPITDTEQVIVAPPPPPSATSLTIVAGTPEPIPPPPPTLGVIPSYALETNHGDWSLYTSRVNQQIAGTFTEYKPTQMLAWWDGDGRTNNAARDNAVTQFRAQLSASLTKWNANQDLTEFSGGQYLYAVERIRDWCLVLNWCGGQLTAQEKSDAEMILARCISNMRTPPVSGSVPATWGTGSFPWPGWAQNNPGNNYYYSHLESVVLWALHSNDPQWAAHLRTVMLPALETYFATMQGGGSQEGTYYGKSYRNLFRALWLWKQVTGETIDIRIGETIEYWVRSSYPASAHSPIGDQAAINYPAMSDVSGDYVRAVVLWGVRLEPTCPQAPMGRAWLTANTHQHNRGDYWFLAFAVPGTSTAADLSTYHATAVGHLFAKDASGVLLTVAAGPLVESHDHHDQGECQLYQGGAWRIASNNIWSSSGIRQGVKDHNCLQFGTTEQTSAACSLAYTDNGTLLDVDCNLTAAYGQAVTREVKWDRTAKKITITDAFTGSATWRCFVNQLPSVSGDTVTTGALTIKQAGGTPVITDMEAIEPTGFNQGSAGPWRIEFVAGTPVEVSW